MYPYGYYIIEPRTGLISAYEERFQVNVYLENNSYFDLDQPVYFPLFQEIRTYNITEANA